MLKGAVLWLDSWTSESDAEPVCEKIKPTELLEVFPEEGILLEWGFDPEINSGRSSEYENDGAIVAREGPTM